MHKKIHPRTKGAIRAALMEGRMTKTAIADKYHVSESTVYHVWTELGPSQKHVRSDKPAFPATPKQAPLPAPMFVVYGIHGSISAVLVNSKEEAFAKANELINRMPGLSVSICSTIKTKTTIVPAS